MTNGFVPTPPRVADFMVADLFGASRPDRDTRVLLPGLGTGRLHDAIERYCTKGDGWIPEFEYPRPACVGVEIDATLVNEFRERHPDADPMVHEADFLLDPPAGPFDHVVANPPYVRYSSIEHAKREGYRDRFTVAVGQFDLYYCFFDQALRLLRPGGTLTFLTPIRYLTLGNAHALRGLLRLHDVGHIYLMPEVIFDEMVTTVVTTIEKRAPPFSPTSLWLEALYGYEFRALFPDRDDATLDDRWATYGHQFGYHRRHVLAHERREHDPGVTPDDVHPSRSGHQANLQAWSDSGC